MSRLPQIAIPTRKAYLSNSSDAELGGASHQCLPKADQNPDAFASSHCYQNQDG